MRRNRIAGFALVLAIAALFSCASPPPARAPGGISLSAAFVSSRAVSADSLALSWDVRIANEGDSRAAMGVLTSELRLENAWWSLRVQADPAELAPGASVTVPLTLIVPIPNLKAGEGDPFAEWSLETSIDALADGRAQTFSDSASGFVPRVGKPEFKILSIAIRQDDLINTRLYVKIRVTNPNSFPVSMSSFRHELFGESRYWASGSAEGTSVVPPQDSLDLTLELTMNFTQMNRQVLDQVLRLERVLCRLSGEVTVDLDMEYFPPFVLPFDMSDSVAVTR